MCVPAASQVHRFLVENDEVSKLRERQGLVDLEGFDLGFETSLQGIFGVGTHQLLVVLYCRAAECDCY